MDNSDRIDWMIDIETTGLDANRNAITSVALLEFQPGRFNRNWEDVNWLHCSLSIPEDREWCAQNAEWRRKNPQVHRVESNIPYMDYEVFLAKLYGFLTLEKTRTPHLWAKPLNFDLGFLTSYCNAYNHGEVPWHYRNVHDVMSFAEGRGCERDAVHKAAAQMMEWQEPHNALWDAHFQTALLRRCFN
jgi:DNA polymerase III epsilon subunit-like protein